MVHHLRNVAISTMTAALNGVIHNNAVLVTNADKVTDNACYNRRDKLEKTKIKKLV